VPRSRDRVRSKMNSSLQTLVSECEQSPPQLLAAYGNLVKVDILIHAVSATHTPIVMCDGCRLIYINLALLGR